MSLSAKDQLELDVLVVKVPDVTKSIQNSSTGELKASIQRIKTNIKKVLVMDNEQCVIADILYAGQICLKGYSTQYKDGVVDVMFKKKQPIDFDIISKNIKFTGGQKVRYFSEKELNKVLQSNSVDV